VKSSKAQIQAKVHRVPHLRSDLYPQVGLLDTGAACGSLPVPARQTGGFSLDRLPATSSGQAGP